MTTTPANMTATADSRAGISKVAPYIGFALLAGALVWSYLPTILALLDDWERDDNYSVGQLAPFAALYLLWNDRKKLQRLTPRPAWAGLVLIALAHFARMFGLQYMYESAERYALVLSIIGIVLLVMGWRVFWQTKWILLFLFLMVPLPGRVHNAISGPLQGWATTGAVASLELMGVKVAQAGHQLRLNDSVDVAVAEACSGLRMLTAFIMVAAVLAYIVPRPRWQKAVVVLSSVPIAILCNLIRLVVTALLFLTVSSEFGERFSHDFAGWVMMPMAVLIIWGELALMKRLVIEDADEPTQAPV